MRRRPHPLAAALALLACMHGPAHAAPPAAHNAVAESTWVDHDRAPISMPPPWGKKLLPHKFRESVVEPLSHAFDIPDKLLWLAGGAERDAVNVNAFDEVSNSSWFTNRNHVRALTPSEIRGGPAAGLMPKPPYTIRSVKREGVNPGFQVRDADGRRWIFKLDPPGYPQLGSGAGVVSSRLLWAAGYNFSHDVAFRFRRDELSIDPRLVEGAGGVEPFGAADLDSLLVRGHRSPAGEWYAQGSLFLTGTPLGPIDFRGRRGDDPNDWYTHRHRRELRGLYVVQSWIGNWDLKDQQSLAMFERDADSLGAVRHTLLDAGASLGAAAEGPKQPHRGYEYDFDMGWVARRLFSLGFAVEPWRNTDQETGIPSAGNFGSVAFEPDEFKPIQPHAAFRERTEADGYWGAKIVGSFSDAQIDAAVGAAGYEETRAAETIARLLRERREKTTRYWFGRVAPLDFVHVDGGTLRFHDLAVDLGWATPRRYEVRVVDVHGHAPANRRLLAEPSFALEEFGDATALTLELRVAGVAAAPALVELERSAAGWRVRRVRHG